MTNSSPSSVRKGVASRLLRCAPCAAFLGLALVAGCGTNDGSSDYRKGCAAFEAGTLAEAETAFAACLTHAPANVDALLMLARTEVRLGEMVKAGEAIARAETLAGGDPDVLELSAQIAFQAKDCGKARTAYAKLAANAAFGPVVQSRGYAGLGVIDYSLISQETLEETAARARTEFLTAIRLDARNAAAHYHLGRLYADVFNYPEIAQSELALFAYLAPKDDPRRIRVEKNLLPRLKEDIAAALMSHPGAGRRNAAACSAALVKGDAALAKGQPKTAKLHYSEAYAADVLSYPAAIGMARCAETQKEAIKYYKIASEIRPSSGTTLIALGDAAVKGGSPAVAEQAYSRAVAASPKDQVALARLVALLRKNGKTRVADVYQRYAAALPARKP